jgi:hypothetical protein
LAANRRHGCSGAASYLACLRHIWCADATKTWTFRPPTTNHLFKKIRDAVEARELAFFETPAGFALTYAGMITLSGRYAEARDPHVNKNVRVFMN